MSNGRSKAHAKWRMVPEPPPIALPPPPIAPPPKGGGVALATLPSKIGGGGAGGGGGDTVDKDPSVRIAYAYSKFSKPCARESYKLALQDYKDSRLLNNTGDCITTANGHHQKDLLGESTVCADRSKALLARRRERMRRHQVKIASMAA